MVIQGGEDPTLFLESLPYSSQWNVGPVNRDNLAATAYARVRQPYIARFRTVPVSSSATVGAQNVSILLPESLQVMLSCYLRIDLPALAGPAIFYRKFVGARILREVRILSAGQQVMACDFRDVMTDYLTNLERSAYESFCDTHLGGRTETNAARTVLVPIPLWNSSIFARSHTGHLGCIPAAGFANNRLEFIFDFCDAKDLTTTGVDTGVSFSSVQMEIHEALMPSAAMRAYARQNGNYSLISRAMRRLGTTDNQEYTAAQAAAGTVVTFECASPAGSFEEIIIVAVKKNAGTLAAHDIDLFDYIQPTSMALVCDSRNVRVLDSAKAQLEMYSNGFTNNEDIVVPMRFCLGSHTRAYGSSSYCGAFAFDAVSNVQVQLSFAEACYVRILGICKARYSITTTGEVRQSLR